LAKRDKRHPALRGDQVSRWLRKGILRADQLGDTPILVVREAVRVRLTPKYRTTLGQGIFLVPRWIRIPPERWREFRQLSEQELAAKAVILGRGSVPYRLIYQMVEDIDHLCRQQQHILDRGKGRSHFERHIKPHIAGRRQAARSLRQLRRQQLELVRNHGIAPLGKKLNHPERMSTEAIEEALIKLDEIIADLDNIIERPLATRRKRAQRSLRAAQRQLRKGNFRLAQDRLRTAWKNLLWPKEK